MCPKNSCRLLKKKSSHHFYLHAETKISADASRVTQPAELNEMVQYDNELKYIVLLSCSRGPRNVGPNVRSHGHVCSTRPIFKLFKELITIRIIAFCRYQCLLVHIFHSSIAFLSASSSYSAHIYLEELSVVPYQWVISGSRGDTINRTRMYAGQGKETHLFHNLHTSS